jgi:hypothetical protein
LSSPSTNSGSCSFMAATPATSCFVFRGTLESVRRNLSDLKLKQYKKSTSMKKCKQHEAHPCIGTMPGFLLNPALVYESAPPNTATELSTPLGLPCNIFSLTKAHRLTSSASTGGIVGSTVAGAGWAGSWMRECRSKRAVAAQAEKDAEEPRPAPTGSVARAENLKDGLIALMDH